MAVKLNRNQRGEGLIGLACCLIITVLGAVPTAAQDSSLSVSSPAGNANQQQQPSSGWWDAIERGGPAGPLLGDYSSELGDFHITGFLQNVSGIWVNSSNLREFTGKQNGGRFPKVRTPHSNSLATERNWTQIDATYNYGPASFFLRWWGVYEPPYPNESRLVAAGAATNKIYDFYNQWTVRDAWLKYRLGPVALFAGRQIVIWGESVSFRVGDVINPQDLSYAFGFANLEQSRTPLWMVHPIVDLPDFGPFTSNDLEGVFVPSLQPLYTNVAYPDNRQFGRQNSIGSVDILPPATGARFAGRPYPFLVPVQNPGAPLNTFAFPQVVGVPGPTRWFYPAATWANSQAGVRYHTLFSDSELDAFYWHGHTIAPTSYVSGLVGHQFIAERFPQINDVAITGNRPMYLPGRLGEFFPFVLRGESVIQDRTPINTQNLQDHSAVRSSATINTLVALDLASAYAPWLTETGTLTTHLEWNNFNILSPPAQMVSGGTALHGYHNDENFLLSVGTSWLWNEVAPSLTGIYNPNGTTIEVFPDLLLTPPWSNKYTLDFKYISVFGNNKYGADGGVFKGKSMFIWTVQYNFNLL